MSGLSRRSTASRSIQRRIECMRLRSGRRGAPPNNSALLGLIWQPTAKNLFLDAGVRHGISRAAPEWQFTLGMTYGFPVSRFFTTVAARRAKEPMARESVECPSPGSSGGVRAWGGVWLVGPAINRRAGGL